MRVDLFLIIFLSCSFSSLAQVQESDDSEACRPPTPGCTCHKGAMSCTGRKIMTFPTFEPAEAITDFSFVGCQFPGALKIPYVNATSLIFDDCDLTSFADDAFTSLSNLRQLSISNNPRILNLSTSAFTNLTNLTRLVLSHNGLTVLPSGFFDIFPKLQELDVSNNEFNVLGDMFGERLSGYTSFKCETCRLTSIPKNLLQGMTTLQTLDLNGNNFSALSDNAFPALGSLTTLRLDGCQLKEISNGAFANLTSLTSLDLANNLLLQIYKKTFEPFYNSLKVLHLQNNLFQTMIEDRAPWSQLDDLKLGGNPWTCDCVISWMPSQGKIDHENVTCANPESLRGKNIFKMEENAFCASVPLRPVKTAVVLGIAIPVIIICLALIVYYVYQIVTNRRRQTRERNSSFKYRSVYGDTVETNSRQHILS